MIVMGIIGVRGLKEIFMGSVVGEVLENVNCLVFVIFEKVVFDGEIDDIVFVVNYQDEEVEVFQKVVEICQLFNVKIYCVNVDLFYVEDYCYEMDQFKGKLFVYDNIIFEVIESMDIWEGLIKYMEIYLVDVLVMVIYKCNFFQELFWYSYVKEMLYYCNMLLLFILFYILG